MAKRLVRAKAKIKAAGIPFRVPAAHLLPDRLAAVLAVVYLIFNEGYGGRGELASEAIRLGRALAELMPDEPEVRGLLALMLVNDARRDARFADGAVVPLDDQDRSLWDDDADRGRDAPSSIGPWRSVAAVPTWSRPRSRSCTPTSPRTGLRSRPSTASSARLTGSSVVELNRAVAIAEAGRGRGRARGRRPAGPRPLPLPARDSGRAPAPARPHRGRALGLLAGARARSLRRRAQPARAAVGGARGLRRRSRDPSWGRGRGCSRLGLSRRLRRGPGRPCRGAAPAGSTRRRSRRRDSWSRCP